MKKFIVIGNPIDHSLSPKLHNYWLKNYGIFANYEKKKIDKKNLKDFVIKIKNDEIQGANITVPLKNDIIKYIDELSDEAKKTQSVNTIFKKGNKIVGHNTDIAGFELAIRHVKYDLEDKKVLILGAGGVVPSILYALQKFKINKIILSNRTLSKAEEIKKRFNNIYIEEWGSEIEFDLIINATSLGLKQSDQIKIDFDKIGKNKFFFDVIYNPRETNFLKMAKINNHKVENGLMMFIYQAHQAFTLWHNIMPIIDDKLIDFINK